MSKFKVGNTIRRRNYSANSSVVVDGIYKVDYYDRYHIKLEGIHGVFDPKNFELYEEKPKFDLKKDAWFISTPTPEISKLAQEWLFSQGIVNGACVSYTDTYYLTNAYMINTNSYLMYTNQKENIENAQEIKLIFKTTIDSVIFPEKETEAQKQLRVLEKKIAELVQQAEILKKSINP